MSVILMPVSDLRNPVVATAYLNISALVINPGTGNSRDPGLSHFPNPGKKVSGIPGNFEY